MASLVHALRLAGWIACGLGALTLLVNPDTGAHAIALMTGIAATDQALKALTPGLSST